MIKLDARRLLCPMPVIRLQDAFNEIEVGSLVEITCTDPGVLNDIPAWCNINRHSILDITEKDDEYIILARKENDD